MVKNRKNRYFFREDKEPPQSSTMSEKVADRKPRSKVECCGYPLSIFFIVINEFCERFSYYGMRAVLVLYFRYFLQWDDDTATSIYHTFVALCYLTPILGAIVADSWLGKFKTIIYLSIVYTVGQVIMAISSIHDLTDTDRDGTPNNLTLHVALLMLGMILIALGTGGIKPCVAAFGGDQFEDHQEKQSSTFFSIFYLYINAGSLLSTVITPILRGQECGIHTQQICYPLAFGVPAALTVVALIVFIAGSSMYKKVSPQGNIMLQVCKCIGFALNNRFKHRSDQYPKRQHWMDWASDKYDKRLVAQIKMVLRVLFLYLPLPMFWTLFDQQGSRWTFQATTMDGNFGPVRIQPDQMQTVNPILIIILVPIVNGVVYPLIKKCKLNFTPLRKMTVGMLLAALAFIVAAFVQIKIDGTLPKFPSAGTCQMKVLNLGDATVHVNISGVHFSADSFKATTYKDFSCEGAGNFIVSYGNNNTNSVAVFNSTTRHTLLVKNVPSIQSLLVNNCDILFFVCLFVFWFCLYRFVNALENITLLIKAGSKELGHVLPFTSSGYALLPEGESEFVFSYNDILERTCKVSKSFGFGSYYTVVIQNLNCESQQVATVTYIQDIQPHTIHMAWQIPQYFLMAVGEVVFSVTGLEFSYSQAPSNMKSVLQAGWLLTEAVGNIIVLIVAGVSQLPDQADYVLFSALLVAVSIVFSIMAYFYTYVDPGEIEAQFDEEDKKKNDDHEMSTIPVYDNKAHFPEQSKM
ncbi:solute carrier family 15 member 1-like [Acipenser oxyrinchus oxyrinchus]|uniref:Solute carrier family 15 member 1-like n=1 Tax=Acipenser oxyrinchus oxyrinchus TaxID=40147 RepID=A0AAD8G3X8_ACIOX|nr:solute carrier family 15 member 1-like [Acipenser oxyrinchus oxyrinchus]